MLTWMGGGQCMLPPFLLFQVAVTLWFGCFHWQVALVWFSPAG
jgi:hypothetical protein